MSSPNQENVDIVIVGAGMVGASLALALSSNENFNIVVVDGAPSVASPKQQSRTSVDEFDLRVSAITAASQKLLDNLGVWTNIKSTGVSPYRHMYVWDAEGTGNVSFDAADLYEQDLGHIIENRVIQSSLQLALKARANVKVLYEQKVTQLLTGQDCSTIILEDGQSFQASLVVAADGANSRLRQWSGLPTREWDYQHHAIVCTVETEKSHQQTAWQRFIDSGPLAFLPLNSESENPVLSSIVWSVEPELSDQLMSLSDDKFCDALSASSEYVLGQVKAVSKRFKVPLRQRHAKNYVKPCFALVGDAAHTIHPLAGQGVNLGFADVMALAEEVLNAAKMGIDIGDIRVLRRYERRRQGDNLAMMGAMEGFKQLFSQEDIRVRWLRNTGMKLFDKLPLLKKEVIGRAMGKGVKVPTFSFD